MIRYGKLKHEPLGYGDRCPVTVRYGTLQLRYDRSSALASTGTVCTLLDVRKTCVNECTLNMRYSIHALNLCLTCVLKNAHFTHVTHFPVYISLFLCVIDAFNHI